MDNHSMMELGEKLNGKFENLVNYCMVSGAINQDLYNEYDVKRGLRDSNGKGVLTGLTEIPLEKRQKDSLRRRTLLSGI